MDLGPYIESVRSQLEIAAGAGGEEVRASAERLAAPLEAAIRLALQDALSAATEEITTELAPGSVELRLRGRDPEFVVNLPPGDASDGGSLDGEETTPGAWPTADVGAPVEGDEASMARINLRMPDHMKAQVERAAAGDGLSVNAWLVRAAAAGLGRTDAARRAERRAPKGAQRYSGWAR